MKRKLLTLGLIIAMIFCFTGCGEDAELQMKRAEIEELTLEINALETELQELSEMIVQEKIEHGIEKYVVTFEIKQSHMFWDYENVMKDEMNATTIEVAVDKEYYDAVNVGTTINDDFRMGSMIMSGSYGSWDISVINKEIR